MIYENRQSAIEDFIFSGRFTQVAAAAAASILPIFKDRRAMIEDMVQQKISDAAAKVFSDTLFSCGASTMTTATAASTTPPPTKGSINV